MWQSTAGSYPMELDLWGAWRRKRRRRENIVRDEVEINSLVHFGRTLLIRLFHQDSSTPTDIIISFPLDYHKDVNLKDSKIHH